MNYHNKLDIPILTMTAYLKFLPILDISLWSCQFV